MLDAAVKNVFANLVAKHVEDPGCLIVSVAVELAGIIEVVAHDRFFPEIAAFEPLARITPALVIRLILAEVRFGPYRFQERGEAFVEPDIAPILAGDEIAEPLVTELVRDQVVFAGEIFGSELGMNQGAAGVGGGAGILHAAGDELINRSEEHTSELQSRSDLVCRLLLEKKKKKH